MNLSDVKTKIAKTNDLSFIINQIQFDAENGHYSQGLISPEGFPGLQFMLVNYLQGNAVEVEGDNGRYLERGFINSIFLNNNIIGFYMTTQNSINQNLEIKMISIQKEHRGKGIAKSIIKQIVKNNKDKTITALCFKNSQAMANIFEGIGFILKKVTPIESKRFEYNSKT